MMDEATYKSWWPLHLRAASGQKLSAEEQLSYEAGLRQLHRDEMLASEATGLRELRKRLLELEGENAKLRLQRAELEREIAALEAIKSDEARELSHVGD